MEPDNKLIEECSSTILRHLERNIIKYRREPKLANKYACMKKYIHHTFIAQEYQIVSAVHYQYG